MELISAAQLGKVIGTDNFPGNKINKLLMWLLRLNDINDVYRDTYFLQREDFIDGVLCGVFMTSITLLVGGFWLNQLIQLKVRFLWRSNIIERLVAPNLI